MAAPHLVGEAATSFSQVLREAGREAADRSASSSLFERSVDTVMSPDAQGERRRVGEQAKRQEPHESGRYDTAASPTTGLSCREEGARE